MKMKVVSGWWLAVSGLLLSGCVISETYEAASYHGGGDARNGIGVAFTGDLFKTHSYTVASSYTYSMGGRHHPMMDTMTTVQNVVETDPDAARVIEYMEERGFIVRGAANANRFTLDISLSRKNIQSPGDFWLVYLGSLTFCDRAEFVQELKVKVYDNATGDLVFGKTFEHSGSKVMFDFIPLFTYDQYTDCELNRPSALIRTSWFYAALDEAIAHMK